MDIHGTIYNWNKTGLLNTRSRQTPVIHRHQHCTFTFETLFDQTPQQTSTVVTESGTHVVVDLETVWHVNFKALLLEL